MAEPELESRQLGLRLYALHLSAFGVNFLKSRLRLFLITFKLLSLHGYTCHWFSSDICLVGTCQEQSMTAQARIEKKKKINNTA